MNKKNKIVAKLDAADLRYIEEMKRMAKEKNLQFIDKESKPKYNAETSARWLVDKLSDFDVDGMYDKRFWMFFLLDNFSEEFGYEL